MYIKMCFILRYLRVFLSYFCLIQYAVLLFNLTNFIHLPDKPDRDMSPIGKDGFSDCRELCDPGNGYDYSCKEQCPEYVFGTPAPTNDATEPTSPVIIDTLIGILVMGFVIAICYSLRNKISKVWRRWGHKFVHSGASGGTGELHEEEALDTSKENATHSQLPCAHDHESNRFPTQETNNPMNSVHTAKLESDDTDDEPIHDPPNDEAGSVGIRVLTE